MNTAISVKGLIKKYKGFTLGPLNLDIEPGIVVGLIGPNGAGKSTAINSMAGLLRTDGGETHINGGLVSQREIGWKFDLGYVSDDPVFYERWTGARNLQFLAQFFPDWSNDRAKELARRFDLDLDKKASQLSKGNRMKLYLVSVLARSPRVMLFDEPTAGLDPVVRSELLDVLWEIMETGKHSVLYSTHILSDINKIADELIFLIDGKIALRCTKDELLDKWRKLSFVAGREIENLPGEISRKRDGNQVMVISADSNATVQKMSALGVVNPEVTPMTIDEIAVAIMKGGNYVERA